MQLAVPSARQRRLRGEPRAVEEEQQCNRCGDGVAGDGAPTPRAGRTAPTPPC